MAKLIFLCRRTPRLTHSQYADHLLRTHVPIALQHHPAMRKYVVNIVETSAAGGELDSVGELFFDGLEDFRERLYGSPAGQEIVQQDVRRFIGGVHAYAASEHVQVPRASGVPLGNRTPGVKMICPVKRRSDMSHAEFVDHWLGRHVPLARRHHPAMIGYVTNVVDERLSEDGEDWDGIAELHFASAEDATSRMFDSPEGERVIRDDIACFIGRAATYFAAEYVQKVPV